MGSIDAGFKPEVFRKDFPQIIATNRWTAKLLGVRLAYDSDGYIAGQVLARNNVSGLFQKYDDGGASGLDEAMCVLYESHPVNDFSPQEVGGTTVGVGIFGGCTLYEDKLIDLDEDAKTSLAGKTIIDASGVELFSF
jgi:hypothetical protein